MLKAIMHNRLAFKLLLPILVVLGLASLLMSWQANNAARGVLLKQVSDQESRLVRLQASLKGVGASDFATSSDATVSAKKFQAIYEQLHTGDVIRLKVWDRSRTVVYSDDKTLIGRNFGANPDLQEALDSGVVQTEITKPGAAENVDERSFPEFMEIYTPIQPTSGGEAYGVIEVYFQLNGLEQSVTNFERLIMLYATTAFCVVAVVLIIVLWLTVLRPIRSLQRATSRVAEGDLSTPVASKSHDEIGQLTQSFNKMLGGLKDLERLRNEFVFVAAHELRAPVTVIKGFLSMASNHEAPTTKAMKEIANANARLEQLVNDLLEIARSDAGKLNITLSEVELVGLVNETMAFFEPLAKEKHIRLVHKHPGAEYRIMADDKRLREVLTNLVSNAIKYGTEYGQVCAYYELKEGDVIVYVDDDGPGISAESQKHIFEKFYRTPEAQSSSVVGTGLGLYITKELVERMGGQIGFTSSLGKGTTFFIRFNLKQHQD